MTLANKITILRILLVPFFVMQMIYYITPFRHGESGREWHRWLAIALFIIAALSDAVDGYVARRYNQKSHLGTILDPLADKILLVSALILLSWGQSAFRPGLPLWFPVLVISRELILLAGAVVLQMIGVHLVVRPRIIGKMATFFQILTIGWVFLKIESPILFRIPVLERNMSLFDLPLVVAGACTLISGLWYIVDGTRQLATSHVTH